MYTNNKITTVKYLLVCLSIVVLAIILSNLGTTKYNIQNYAIQSKHFNKKLKKPDFKEIEDFRERKEIFISYILGAIDISNKEICSQKYEIQDLNNSYIINNRLNKRQSKKLDKYLNYYKISNDKSLNEQFKLLKSKADLIPTSLTLAQAILESGWGTSRFARDYNNYFGLHCFYSQCGVKALNSSVYLEVFNNVNESVLGYYYRLNTGSKFKDFRKLRKKSQYPNISINKVLDTFGSYSELGKDEYKKRLELIIKHNDLKQYDSTKYC